MIEIQLPNGEETDVDTDDSTAAVRLKRGDPAALKWREEEANFREEFAPRYREGADLDRAERVGASSAPGRPGGDTGSFEQ